MSMSIPAFAVITAIGPNRIGIVEELSGIVSNLGASISESRMALLGGEFAVLMLVEMVEGQLEGLERALKEKELALNLRIELKRTQQPSVPSKGRPYVLETVSLDTPGIVHAATAVLTQHGIDIEELETSTHPAPWTGAPMFHMRATIILGPEISLSQLKADLALLESERDLDIHLHPAAHPLEE